MNTAKFVKKGMQKELTINKYMLMKKETEEESVSKKTQRSSSDYHEKAKKSNTESSSEEEESDFNKTIIEKESKDRMEGNSVPDIAKMIMQLNKENREENLKAREEDRVFQLKILRDETRKAREEDRAFYTKNFEKLEKDIKSLGTDIEEEINSLSKKKK